MTFPPQALDQIKARLSLVEEVRRTLPNLKKKGRYWWANCPFHNEKSASFHVREEGNYYCFGCGAAGDIITFTMETQGTDFPTTVKALAQRAGVKLPEDAPPDPAAAGRRAQGLQALERAAAFYQSQLAGSPAAAYVQKRALTPETIENFGLGYSPEGWTTTRDALTQEGFGVPTLREAGLSLESDKGKGDYDRFRGRLMFPIHDLQGRTVGFGGRILDKGEPKYLNSPETPFFGKSHLLYNLHRAKPEMRLRQQALLVEGYMDVIALWQAGLKTAVAPLGTSVTEDQLTLLWQQIAKPTVCLDGDAAGRTAALRVAQKALPLLEPGRTLQFVWLPEGEDPDSLIKKDGLAALQTLLSEPTSLEDVLWQHLTAGQDLTHADARATIESNMGALIGSIRHATVRRAYSQTLRDRLWQATRGGRAGGRKANPGAGLAQAPANYIPATGADESARQLLALLLRWPHILPQTVETLGGLTFPAGELADLSNALLRGFTAGQAPEQLSADLAEGLFAETVADLLRATGVITLPDETDALMEFNNLAHQRQIQHEQKQADKHYYKNPGAMFSAEKWEKFKQSHRANTSPSTDGLTPPPRRPM